KRSNSFVNSSGVMSYFDRHIAPLSANPSSLAPLFASSTKRAYSVRIGGGIGGPPSHTPRTPFSSRASRTTPVVWLMSRQLSGFFGSSHHLPLPYSPSRSAAIFVSSSPSFGFDGVAITRETFKIFIDRRKSGGSSTPSNFTASLAYWAILSIIR